MKKSSSIKDVKWFEGLLYVTFHSGSIYEYVDVSEETYADFLRAESLGKFFIANIKGKYIETKAAENDKLEWPFPGGEPLSKKEKKIKDEISKLPKPWVFPKASDFDLPPVDHGSDVANAWPFPTGPKPIEGYKDPVLELAKFDEYLEWTEEEEQALDRKSVV